MFRAYSSRLVLFNHSLPVPAATSASTARRLGQRSSDGLVIALRVDIRRSRKQENEETNTDFKCPSDTEFVGVALLFGVLTWRVLGGARKLPLKPIDKSFRDLSFGIHGRA